MVRNHLRVLIETCILTPKRFQGRIFLNTRVHLFCRVRIVELVRTDVEIETTLGFTDLAASNWHWN